MAESIQERLAELQRRAEADAECRADLKETVRCLMYAFGGPAGIAKLLRMEFDHAEDGSTVRSKTLTTILDLMKATDDEEGDRDPETEALIDQMLSGANGNAGS